MAFGATILMARYCKVDDVPATISFLASAGSGSIIGHKLRVDGGLTRFV